MILIKPNRVYSNLISKMLLGVLHVLVFCIYRDIMLTLHSEANTRRDCGANRRYGALPELMDILCSGVDEQQADPGGPAESLLH